MDLCPPCFVDPDVIDVPLFLVAEKSSHSEILYLSFDFLVHRHFLPRIPTYDVPCTLQRNNVVQVAARVQRTGAFPKWKGKEVVKTSSAQSLPPSLNPHCEKPCPTFPIIMRSLVALGLLRPRKYGQPTRRSR